MAHEFQKILIANRGEIAVRIIRACRDLGIVSLAVYSEADKTALHTQIADEAVCIGPARSAESYLNADAILTAAIACKADAIHPGFGFLSENAEFARRCAENGIVFIGPSPETIEKMGDKAMARKTVIEAGVPVVPGSEGELADYEEIRKAAALAGYPVMLKAAAGGGGRGIRRVENEEELSRMVDACRSEALACFGDDRLYVEKCILSPRHIEIQILADSFGNVIHLFERDCSVQRRNQKLVEEAPSGFLSDETRRKMGETAVAAAKAANYCNAGTVEFLLDRDETFYFMEMNTRIQVEHPVTEFITGMDIVVEQINIAAGKPLSVKQEDLKPLGHAIECRINAEDAARNFAPCPGEIRAMHLPGGPGVRVDGAIYQGYVVPPYYDSMLAKLIVHGKDREQAIERMRRALCEFLIDGVTTNTDFQMAILKNETFCKRGATTDFLVKEKLI